ncbi:MAG: hypothetical protein AAGH41_14040 [Pseudomonadota bacterium]
MIARSISLFIGAALLTACSIRTAPIPVAEPIRPQLVEAEAPEAIAPQPATRRASVETPAEPEPDAAALENSAPLPIPQRDILPIRFYPDAHLVMQADLLSDNEARVNQARLLIESAPQDYPPYLYAALSDALARAGAREEAQFWYYTSELRARYDANRCNLSTSAERHVRVLTEVYGKGFALDAIERPKAVAETLASVIAFDAGTDNRYDPRWIYYLPVDAEPYNGRETNVPPADAACQPEERWPLIKEATRLAYQREMASRVPGFEVRRTALLSRQPGG